MHPKLVSALQATAVVIFLCLLAEVLSTSHAPETIRSPEKPTAPTASPALAVSPMTLENANPAPPVSEPVVAASTPPPAKPSGHKSAKTGKAKPEIQDPTARLALSFVGADPEAESYWVSAINDPNLPAEERKDLIEDLNEDGLSDPKHPGPQDVPLIVSRLRLIEELAPLAMDPVNAAAFGEAYKDLNNLLAGQPVP